VGQVTDKSEPPWRVAAKDPILTPGEVHVWRVHLNQSEPIRTRLLDLLSQDEREKAGRFYFQKDRDHFVVARGALRSLLGGYLNVKPERLQFCYTEYGKPYLAGEFAPEVRFNLSHSHELALFGITLGRRLGIDVEFIRQDVEVEEIAGNFFSGLEVSVLMALPKELRRQAFFNCWTRKEAYIKAIGEGLSHPLHDFDVTLAPGDPAVLLCTRVDPREAALWSMRAIDAGEGYAAAVAVKGLDWELECWDWS
jgi:4'-phosphopantetheinyl transferase